jgi:hypothetical protein
MEQLKNLKNENEPVSYLGLELTIHVIKSQIHLVRQSLSYTFLISTYDYTLIFSA